jgi:SAM-dependent methyltransferase
MVRGLTSAQDAFGHFLIDYLEGKPGQAVYEVDDGFVEPLESPERYFAAYKDWWDAEKQTLRFARGRVFDVGCGAGRIALHLQEKGLDVLGIDISPLAVRACKRRGLKKARVVPVTQVSRRLGTFDTIIMFGNNFSLTENAKRAKWLFRRFHRMTSDHAVILAQSVDPYQTEDPRHLACHVRNRRRGRMAGQVRIRLRYGTYATPWFDCLMVSKQEMQGLLNDAGWKATRFLDTNGPVYFAVIEKV